LTFFVLACGVLLLLSALFYAFPKRRPGEGVDEDLMRSNVEWYRLREAELAQEGAEGLTDDARLRLLEDEQQGVDEPAVGDSAGQGFPRWILFPVVALASGLLYLQLGAAPDVLITRQLQALTDESTPRETEQLMAQIQARAEDRPDNLNYIALLGRYYMGQQNYARAADSYGELARQAPEDAQALAFAAQAGYLASNRTLDDASRMQAEQALAIDPHQRTALGLLGMASFEQGQYRAAIEYWERLMAMEAPNSDNGRMIASVIASARQRLGADGMAGDGLAPGAAEAGLATGVSVTVSLPDGAQLASSDTVFVLARSAASDSRMPIAVQRLRGDQLPVTLRLDDTNSMAGQKLSESESVVVVVQVSPDGTPGESGATWLGRAGPLEPSTGNDPLPIVLQPRDT
tara:strand:+ start:137454 stop:138665 length:1212 start_codon:yes stop_codon:yes gene_type:complete